MKRIIALILALLLLCGLTACGESSTKTKKKKETWKTTFNNFVAVTFEGNVDKLEKLAPEEYWIWYEDEYGLDLDDIKEEIEDNQEELEDEYGKNISVTIDVEKEKQLSDKKVENIANALEDQYDIDAKSVTEVIEIKGVITIKGTEDEEDEDVELTFAKIGKSWYMISFYEYDGEYYVSFLAH